MYDFIVTRRELDRTIVNKVWIEAPTRFQAYLTLFPNVQLAFPRTVFTIEDP